MFKILRLKFGCSLIYLPAQLKNSFMFKIVLLLTRAKQAQACNTATCLRISDIFTYLFRYLLIHSITY